MSTYTIIYGPDGPYIEPCENSCRYYECAEGGCMGAYTVEEAKEKVAGYYQWRADWWRHQTNEEFLKHMGL